MTSHSNNVPSPMVAEYAAQRLLPTGADERAATSRVSSTYHAFGGPELPLLASSIKFAVLIPCLLFSASSWASDIQCDRTQQPAQRVICDHAILNHEYDDIYEQQQTLLQEGKLTPSDLAAWKQKRDACTDVHCIDGVFAEASTLGKIPENSAAAPVVTASEALGPAAGALPASPVAPDASQQASSVPVSRQGSAYGVALPQSVPSDASAPAPLSAASANMDTTADGASSRPFVIALGLLFVIALLAVGAMFMYRRKRGR